MIKKDGDEIVCYCSDVTKSAITQALSNGAKTLDDIKKATGACTVAKCKEMNPAGKCCAPRIRQIMQEYFEKNQA